MGVPELWRYTRRGLQINLLQEGKYVESNMSPNFPNIPIIELVNEYVDRTQREGRSQAIRAFKLWVKENLRREYPPLLRSCTLALKRNYVPAI
ncbi:hypothetical protein LAY57_24775 [Argonema antarcticum A004/B2]|nr:hypothetical protein [Argonema antarcticum A004/B2]